MKLFLEVSKGETVVSCTAIPLGPPTPARIFPSDSAGCLRTSYIAGEDDLWVRGENLPPGAAVRVDWMEDRTAWEDGTPLIDLRGAPTVVELGTSETDFLVLLASAQELPVGAFDLLTQVNVPMSPIPPFLETVDLGVEPVFSVLFGFGVYTADPLDFEDRVFGLARNLSAGAECVLGSQTPFGFICFSQLVEHRDTFVAGERAVYLRVAPLFQPALANASRNVFVVPSRGGVEWLLDTTLPVPDAAGGPAVVPFGDLTALAAVPLWPDPVGGPGGSGAAYDIVVDVNDDGLYTPGTDLIDRPYDAGFRALPDPGAAGPMATATTDYFGAFAWVPPSDPSITAMQIQGTVWYPVDAGARPLFLILQLDLTDEPGRELAYLGYDYLLEHLASHGFVAASARAVLPCPTCPDLTRNLYDDLILLGPIADGGQNPLADFALEHLLTLLARSVDATDDLFGRVDATQLYVAGHSYAFRGLTR